MTWRSGTHLFGVLEVLEHRLLSPGDRLVHVSRRVREAFRLAGLATEDTGKSESETVRREESALNVPVQVGADLVGLASTESVALSTPGLEETSTFSSVTYKNKKTSSASALPFSEK